MKYINHSYGKQEKISKSSIEIFFFFEKWKQISYWLRFPFVRFDNDQILQNVLLMRDTENIEHLSRNIFLVSIQFYFRIYFLYKSFFYKNLFIFLKIFKIFPMSFISIESPFKFNVLLFLWDLNRFRRKDFRKKRNLFKNETNFIFFSFQFSTTYFHLLHRSIFNKFISLEFHIHVSFKEKQQQENLFKISLKQFFRHFS